jgi:putative hydrolase of the HAD superfamily
VSNTNEIHWDRFSKTWKLVAAFHHNFPSYLVGKLKPDAEYFLHVLEALDVPAQRVLFVDDNAINVEAAARLGMHTRRVQGVAGARQAFVELGIVSEDAP